jgi:hypothetical protein
MQNIIKLKGLKIEKYVACRCSRLDPEGFGGIPAHQQQREIQSGIAGCLSRSFAAGSQLSLPRLRAYRGCWTISMSGD